MVLTPHPLRTPFFSPCRAEGESNVNCNFQTAPAWETNYYARLLPQLVKTWREAFGLNFAALIVQLAAYGGAEGASVQRMDALPALRLAQDAVLALPATAVALAIDLGDDGKAFHFPRCPFNGGIHPRNKTEVGRRVALKLAEIEGVLPAGAVASGPVPAAGGFAPSAAGATLSFTPASIPNGFLQLLPTANCTSLLPAGAAAAAGCCQVNATASAGTWPFELRLADNATYVLAAATIDSDGGFALLDLAPLLPQAGPFTGARYSAQSFPLCSLVNSAGLPMAPFVI